MRGATRQETPAGETSNIRAAWSRFSGNVNLALFHVGTRTVLEYLLSPVQKVAHEAGRER